jgi:hypothetical protein
LPDFVQRLKEQLGFIKTSAEQALNGNWREGLRIATAVRVIVHQTSRSTSLLTHLGCQNPEMLSTTAPIPPGAIFGVGGLTMIAATEHGMHVMPALGRGPEKRIIAFSDWWAENVYVFNGLSLSREKLVLTAADKDGGAHVDAGKMPEDYERLKQGLWTVGPMGFEHQAMMTLVQVGFEVDHSPGINRLMKPQT